MFYHSRPENVNDPLPRPLHEMLFLPEEEDMAFWRQVLPSMDYKQMRIQSYTLYQNKGALHVEPHPDR